MWVHFNRDKDVLNDQDLLQARRGKNVLGSIRVTDTTGIRSIQFLDNEGNRLYQTMNAGSSKTARQQLSGGHHFHGAALYRWVKSEPTRVEGGRWALVHKPFVKLKAGQKFSMRPMSNALNCTRYDLEVISETTFDKPMFEVEIVNVDTKGSWRSTGVEKLTDLKFLDKHSAYMFIKEEPVGFKQLVAAENKINPQSQTIEELRRRLLKLEKTDLDLRKTIKTQGDALVKLMDTSDPTGQYIIWCPTSNLPPRKINTGRAQAKAIAASMSERHGTTFYWCKLMGKVEQKVIKTTETKITEM